MIEVRQRAIVHLDADAFFASVEQAADARLRGKPVAVGGEKRGIIASASYEARKFGIYTPMPSALARRLCPKLVLLPGDFEKYELFSRLMFSYAYDFTPEVEIGSIDEGYFDLTGVRRPASGIAETIRRAIRQSLRLSVSEGIASNKLVSQIASKLNKPAAFQLVGWGEERGFLAPLANRWLPGVGPRTATRLSAAGLARIGQIAGTPPDLLGLLVGNGAPQLRRFALGEDERPVVPARAPAKSYGEQETFAADTTDQGFLEATLQRMADKLMAKVRADGKSIRTLTVMVRYNDMDQEQASKSLAEPTDLETDIYGQVIELLRKAWKRRVSLRLVSLKLANVYDGRFRSFLPLEAADRQHDARQRLADAVDCLRQKYGRAVLLRGHDFVLRERAEVLEVRRTEGGGQRSEVRGQRSEMHGAAGAARDQRLLTSSPTGRTERGSFVPLNVHSYYSFLDSTLSIPAIVAWAKRQGLRAIALTDRGNLHGAVEFALAAAEAGIKPIIGAEVIWQGRRVCLYVQNQTGYHNLCRILSPPVSSDLESPTPGRRGLGEGGSGTRHSAFRMPHSVDTGGLLALSPHAELAEFFSGRFYLEAGTPEALAAAGDRLPCVASVPVHYEAASDRWKYDVVQSIRTLTLLRQEHREKELGGEYHFRAAGELGRVFAARPDCLERGVEIAERCEFTLRAGKPQFPSYAPPDGSAPGAFLRRLVMAGLERRYPGEHARLKAQVEEELGIITEVGYQEYFLVMWDILQECRRRGISWITRGSAADSLACYCLGISDVCPIRFDLYFRRFLNRERLAMQKLPDIDVDFPHDRKDDVIDLIFEKYGAGHAAVVGGFSTFQSRSAFAEVAKVLGVSEFQARRITERLPHFSRASELAETAAATLECRDLPLEQEPYASALRMARFLDGFPRYAKMHPCGVVLSRQPMLEITPCFVSAKGYPTTHFDMDSVEAVGLVKMDILAQGGLAVMRDVIAGLEVRSAEYGVSRRVGISLRSTAWSGEWPAGKVHSPQSTVHSHGRQASSPTGRRTTRRRTTDDAARRSRSQDECMDRSDGELKRRDGEDAEKKASQPASNSADRGAQEDASGTGSCRVNAAFPIGPAPWDDAEVWEMIAGGQARAVHHIESPAMISLCRMCDVRDIDTLIAIVSVIRPGAANESRKMEFARRYLGLSPVRYPHPSLERCLRSTHGLVVYEEHILQICEAFAGLPPGRADVLRRALGKENDGLIGQIQGEFAEAARRRGRSEGEIAEVWAVVASFRGYAFCKAHSTAYGIEAYQSAWLKRYYPAHFMAAVLSNGKGFYHPLVYVLECHRLGLGLLPPTVNEPGPQFTARGDKIRVPLLRVKGLGERTAETILRERERGEFSSLHDFFLRVQPLAEEMEAFIRVGAFDAFGQSRTTQYWQFSALCAGRAAGPVSAPASRWLLPPASLDHLPSVPLAEPGRLERLRWEEELLGFPASGHPLELFPDIAWETYCPVSQLGRYPGQPVLTCGLVIEQRLFHQATGEPMKFLTLADWTGVVETELFARAYRSSGLATIRYRVLEIGAIVEPFESGRGFSLRVLRAGKPRSRGAVRAPTGGREEYGGRRGELTWRLPRGAEVG